MKRFIISTSVFIFGILITTQTVAAAGYAFSTDLKVGSSGAEVSALQTALIASRYHIPSIESGRFAKGTFGAETLKAVRLYQVSHQISSTGMVGPLTRRSLNDSNLSVGTPSASTTPQVPILTNITTPGVSGTLALGLQATPPNGTVLSKGQEADVVTYKVQAGASDMNLQSIQLDINTRLWLYVSSISVMDGTKVVGEMTNLSASNWSELTAGSNYRISIPTNLIIPKGTVKYLTVHAKALPTSDRSSATISITRFQTRAVDGTSVIDTQSLVSTRTLSYLADQGSIVLTSNPNNPPNMIVPISTAGQTDNVVLGIADVVSRAKDGTLRGLTLYMNTNFDVNGVNSITTLFRDIKIRAGDLVYSADTIGAYVASDGVSTLTFNNMAIPLPKDTIVPVYILAKVNQDTNNSLDGKMASSTLYAVGTAGGTTNNPVVEDASHTTVAINTAPLVTSDLTFTASNADLYSVNPKAVISSQIMSQAGVLASLGFDFSFTITAGDNTLYVSSDPYRMVSTTTSGFGSQASTTWSSITPSPDSLGGDDLTVNKVYVIPAGSSRSFVLHGRSDNINGTNSSKMIAITGIKYGTTATAPQVNTIVYYNYGLLKVFY